MELVASPESLAPDGKLFREKLAAEVFNQQIRRDARKMLDDRDRAIAAGTFEGEDELHLMYDPLPTDAPELIPGLLPESGMAAIAGETNVGKTLLGLEIASSLLTGEPLWGAIQPSRTVKKVVYVLGEHTAVTVQGLYHRTQLPHSGNFRIVAPDKLHPYKALVVAGVAQSIAIDRMLKFTDGAGLIIFDPLSGFAQGSGAENDNSSMRTLVDCMSLVAQKQNSACLVLAHQGKPMLDPTGNEIRRSSYATRGATAIEDSMSYIFYFKKSLAVKQQKDALERYDLVTRKIKGIQTTEVFKLQRDPETQRNTLTNAKQTRGSYPSQEERDELQERITRTLINNPGFTMDTAIKVVADGAGMAEGTLKRWLSTV